MYIQFIYDKTSLHNYIVIDKPHHNSISGDVGLINILASQCNYDKLTSRQGANDMNR